VLVKEALTRPAAAALRNGSLALRDERTAALADLRPAVLATGTLHGRTVVAESAPAGRSVGDELAGGGYTVTRALHDIEAVVRPLWTATARAATLDDAWLHAWVDAPLETLRARCAAPPVTALADELRTALRGTCVELCMVHGDLSPANVTLTDSGDVALVRNWELACPDGLAAVDRAFLMLSARALAAGRPVGAVAAELLRGPLAYHRHGTGISMRAAVLLAWLQHVAADPRVAAPGVGAQRWRAREVTPVMEAIAPPAPVAVGARVAALAPVALLITGLVLWVVSLPLTDVRDMTDLGLVSVLPVTFFAGLLALTAGWITTIRRPAPSGRLLGAHVAALIAMLHATPCILYGTVRYAWSYKHIGIIDYVQRHHGVDTHIAAQPVYHNWPGFFGLDGLLTELAGLPGAIGQALWAPPVFNLLTFAALLFLGPALGAGRRATWAAAWLVFVASWVGQDYFSPQAFAFFLYLVTMGVAARWLRAGFALRPVLAVLGLTFAIVVSHPLTGVMVPLGLAALTLAGVCRVRWLFLAAGAVTALWDITVAWPYVSDSLSGVVDTVQLPWQTTKENLVATSHLSHGQVLVSDAGRAVVLLMAALAAIGTVRLLRAGRLRHAAPALALAAAPALLFAAGDYGGEMLFRIYLFSLPFQALLATEAFGPLTARRSAAAYAAAATALLGGLLFAYYGKDDQYRFSHDEVSAAEYLYSHAAPGSLLVEGTTNYPGELRRYDEFTYVPLDREPVASHARFVRDPVGVFTSWMRDRRYPAAYMVITRSMKIDAAELGTLPPGALQTIETRLLASGRFTVVYRNADATILALQPWWRT
jgi:hypothetical protein